MKHFTRHPSKVTAATDILSFKCPSCKNKTLYSAEQDVHIAADVDENELFICDECGGEFRAHPQYNGSIRFTESIESATDVDEVPDFNDWLYDKYGVGDADMTDDDWEYYHDKYLSETGQEKYMSGNVYSSKQPGVRRQSTYRPVACAQYSKDATRKTDRRLASTSERYRGYLIVLDRGGDGYNIYDEHRELEDAGHPSIESAKKCIDDIIRESGDITAPITSSYAMENELKQYLEWNQSQAENNIHNKQAVEIVYPAMVKYFEANPDVHVDLLFGYLFPDDVRYADVFSKMKSLGYKPRSTGYISRGVFDPAMTIDVPDKDIPADLEDALDEYPELDIQRVTYHRGTAGNIKLKFILKDTAYCDVIDNIRHNPVNASTTPFETWMQTTYNMTQDQVDKLSDTELDKYAGEFARAKKQRPELPKDQAYLHDVVEAADDGDNREALMDKCDKLFAQLMHYNNYWKRKALEIIDNNNASQDDSDRKEGYFITMSNDDIRNAIEDLQAAVQQADRRRSAKQPKSPVKSADEIEDYEDDIQEISQEFTSENTSINSGKLPAIFKMIHLEPGTINIDYGGGKFDNVADYLTQFDVINLVYDPYNRTPEHNKEVIRTVRKAGGADTATCSNVLNVIKEPEVRKNVLENIKKLVKPDGTVYITVYEGSGKGNEGPTKSGYQLNRKTADYLAEIQEVFPDATRKGKLIIAHPNGSPVTSSSYTYVGEPNSSDPSTGRSYYENPVDWEEKLEAVRNLVASHPSLRIRSSSPWGAYVYNPQHKAIFKFDFWETSSSFDDQLADFENWTAGGSTAQVTSATTVSAKFDVNAMSKKIRAKEDVAFGHCSEMFDPDDFDDDVFNKLQDMGFIPDVSEDDPLIIVPKGTVLKYVGNNNPYLLYQVDGTDLILCFDQDDFELLFDDDYEVVDSATQPDSPRSQMNDYNVYVIKKDGSSKLIKTIHDTERDVESEMNGKYSYLPKLSFVKKIEVRDANTGEKVFGGTMQPDSLRSRIYDYLDECGGYTDYNQKINHVSEQFGMSPDEAEGYVWDWSINHDAEWHDTADQEDVDATVTSAEDLSYDALTSGDYLFDLWTLVQDERGNWVRDSKIDTYDDYRTARAEAVALAKDTPCQLVEVGPEGLFVAWTSRTPDKPLPSRYWEPGAEDTSDDSSKKTYLVEVGGWETLSIDANSEDEALEIVKNEYLDQDDLEELEADPNYIWVRSEDEDDEDIDDVYSATMSHSIKSIHDKLLNAASKTMRKMGFPLNEIADYLVVEVEPEGDQIKCEVRAELSYEGMDELANALNPIVAKYDKYAYFDHVTGGIIAAYLSSGKFNPIQSSTDTNSNKFFELVQYVPDSGENGPAGDEFDVVDSGEFESEEAAKAHWSAEIEDETYFVRECDPSDYIEEATVLGAWDVDDYPEPPASNEPQEHTTKKEITINIDDDIMVDASTNDVDFIGDPSFLDDDETWTAESEPMFKIAEPDEVYEHVMDLIIDRIPMATGKYHVRGSVKLVYDVTLLYIDDSTGPDDEHSELDVDASEATYDPYTSEVIELDVTEQ